VLVSAGHKGTCAHVPIIFAAHELAEAARAGWLATPNELPCAGRAVTSLPAGCKRGATKLPRVRRGASCRAAIALGRARGRLARSRRDSGGLPTPTTLLRSEFRVELVKDGRKMFESGAREPGLRARAASFSCQPGRPWRRSARARLCPAAPARRLSAGPLCAGVRLRVQGRDQSERVQGPQGASASAATPRARPRHRRRVPDAVSAARHAFLSTDDISFRRDAGGRRRTVHLRL
jgi:hypothetical protein